MLDLQTSTAHALRLAVTKYKHPYYEHTVKLARMYKAFITGEDLEYMLRKFDRRESEEDFKQANSIAQQITPAITSALMNPARKMVTVKPIVDRVDYGNPSGDQAKELTADLSTFYAGKDVDNYLNMLVDPSDADPNAYDVLTFEEFDNKKQKPAVFPVRVGSENVYDHSYVNGILEYLWLGFKIRYVTKPEQKQTSGEVIKAETAEGMRYVLYSANHHIVLEQIQGERIPALKNTLMDINGMEVVLKGDTGVVFHSAGAEDRYYLRVNDSEVYVVRFFDQKSGQVPAFRLGCRLDPYTGGRTCVNRWHDAVPYLKKSLKQVRELDLTTALHAFPQKIQYVSKCRATGCLGGMVHGNTECTSCKGSGFQTITTAQDHITLPMPKDGQDMIDPSKLIHYAVVPVDIIKVLVELVKETKSDAFKAVYNADIYGTSQVGKTIEEVQAQQQAIYDALQPYAMWWSASRTTVMMVYAAYTDRAKDLVVIHKFPRKFGFETTAIVLQLMRAAKESGASSAVKANINRQLIGQVFTDDPEAMKRAVTQARFDPFPGIDEGNIVSLISGGVATERSALMWTERATIFAEAEAKYPGDVSFYDLSDAKQNEVIKQILDEMLLAKEEKKAANVEMFAPKVGLDPDADMEDEEDKQNADMPPIDNAA